MNYIKFRSYLTTGNIAIAIIAIVLLQTLPFKFLGLPESIEIFTKLGQEPGGRIGSGIFELLGTIGLFIPAIRKYAAIGIACLMMGALYFHATVLGWNGLALSAMMVLVCSLYTIYTSNTTGSNIN